MRKILILLVFFVFLVGCTQTVVNDGKTTVKTSGTKTTVETADGKTTVTAKTGDTGSWCQTGAEWKSSTVGKDNANAKMLIKGIQTSGKYTGLCYVVYQVTSKDSNANIDYYFNKDGKTGYMLMDVNGHKIEQSIS